MSDRYAVYVSGQSGKGVIEKKAANTAGMIGQYDEFGLYRDSICISIGIAMCMEDGVTFEELYSSAAEALADAKNSGANTYKFR